MTLFQASSLARGWLSVSLASAKDSARAALDRTVAVEAFHEGLRLTATDSFVLLTTFVPNVDHEDATDVLPDLDAVPYATTVAMDPHGRGRGFLAHVLKLAAAEAKRDDPAELEVAVRLGVVDQVDITERPTLAGMAVHHVELELHGAEVVRLRTYEGSFPAWRNVLRSVSPTPTERISLSPDVVGRLAKLEAVQGGTSIGFRWGGTTGAALFDLQRAWPPVVGVVMPTRWDFDRNAERDDRPEEDDTTNEVDG